METETLERILGEQPFLKDINQNYLQLIVGCASNVRFNGGEVICKEGDDAKKFYLVRHGRVALQIYTPDRGSITIQTVEPGEIFGWSWLFPPYRWRFDAHAVELTRAIALDGECLRKKCEEDHSLGYEVLKRFSQVIIERLEATRLQLLDVYGVRK